LYAVEHPESRIDAGLRRIPVAADDTKLRISAPDEEMGIAAPAIIVAPHGAQAPLGPVVAIPVPPVAALIPPPAAIIVIIARRALTPRRSP